MQVEAIKREDGLYIPMIDIVKTMPQQKIWVDIEVIEPTEETDGYALLDQMIGLCHTNQEDASVNHNKILYTRGAA
ncbi:MAG: hypothetical protein AB1422_11790 [bacterium]